MLDGVAGLASLDGRNGDLRPPHVHAQDGHRRILVQVAGMDRRLASKNIRTALIAGAISLIIFALSFFAGLVYS
jgi:hypothetical protein